MSTVKQKTEQKEDKFMLWINSHPYTLLYIASIATLILILQLIHLFA